MENQLPNFAPIPQVPPVQKPSHRARTILVIIVVLLLVLVSCVFFGPRILGFVTRDIDPIDDIDLRLEKIDIADADNGYFDLVKLDKVIYYPNEKTTLINQMLDGNAWDEAFVLELLSKNEASLGYFADAAKKSSIQSPGEADPAKLSPDLVMPSLNNWRMMSRISSIKALYLAKSGKDTEAIEESLNSVKIGQMIQDSNITLIEYLVAMAMKNIGLRTTQQTITTSKISTAQIKNYIQMMAKYYENKEGLATAFKSDYALYMQFLTDPKSVTSDFDVDVSDPQEQLGGLSVEEFNKMLENSFYFRKNETQLLFANYVRSKVESAYNSCGEPVEKVPQFFTAKGPIEIYFEENAIGKILHDAVAVSLNTVDVKKCEEQALVGNTQVLLALKAYKNETKELPKTLEELMPTYISSIPLDPFNMKPLRYSLSEKKIYSIHASSTVLIGF